MPIIRTFAPVVAGVGRMEYRRFLAYNVLGGVGWVAGLTWAGYLLGQTIPDIGRYIHVVIVVVIVLSLIPIGVEWWRAAPGGRTAGPAALARMFRLIPREERFFDLFEGGRSSVEAAERLKEMCWTGRAGEGSWLSRSWSTRATV